MGPIYMICMVGVTQCSTGVEFLTHYPSQRPHTSNNHNLNTTYVSSSPARYMTYIRDLVGDDPVTPHNRAVMLVSLTITPVPMFNKMK